ncbi:hypothetical protein TNIN_191011, partial [Trichonephila inaurata madagascariensis]
MKKFREIILAAIALLKLQLAGCLSEEADISRLTRQFYYPSIHSVEGISYQEEIPLLSYISEVHEDLTDDTND